MTQKRKFAAFDIDGTIARDHLNWAVLLHMARNGQLHDAVNEMVLERYNNWKKRTHKNAYHEFDTDGINDIYAILHEVDPAAYDRATDEVLPQIVDLVYLYTKNLATQLKKQDYLLIAISGSRDVEAEYFAKHHGFDDWVGRQHLRTKDGKAFTGEHIFVHDSKEMRLAHFIDKHNLTMEGSYAIGDTGTDIPMLEMVENPIAFNPNEDLLAHAKKKSWKIVIERKSIAFELEPGKDGSYKLVA